MKDGPSPSRLDKKFQNLFVAEVELKENGSSRKGAIILKQPTRITSA
jgi:hypothetical protein